MIKFYYTSIFVLFFSIGFSQSFPNLNASAGNENEFPVDKDTNIYMFHGNRLVKTDKNFNTVWANTYSGFTFYSILLSKTGSIYFMGKNSTNNSYFGKISSTGNLSWIRTVQSMSATVSGTVFISTNEFCRRMILDANNKVVVSGEMQNIGNYPNNCNSFIIKTDTNGIVLKFKAIRSDYFTNFSILSDSSGVYKFIGSGPYLGGIALAFFDYDDNTDSFISTKWGGITPGNSSLNWQVYKSKINSSMYINASITTSATIQNGIIKLNGNGQYKWSKGISASMTYMAAGRIEENTNGDLLYGISCQPGACSSYTSAFIKIDSNGVANSYLTTMLNGYYIGTTFPYPLPAHSQRVIHNNNYYFDISGYSFPSNPLTVQKFNSSLNYACSSTITATYPPIGFSYLMTTASPTMIPISSYSYTFYSSSRTPVTFSVNTNFCGVLGTDNKTVNEIKLNIYPNPAGDKLYINNKDHFVNGIEIFDMNGKNVKTAYEISYIDVHDLINGIYFIRIKTDRGEFNKKFIKE